MSNCSHITTLATRESQVIITIQGFRISKSHFKHLRFSVGSTSRGRGCLWETKEECKSVSVFSQLLEHLQIQEWFLDFHDDCMQFSCHLNHLLKEREISIEVLVKKLSQNGRENLIFTLPKYSSQYFVESVYIYIRWTSFFTTKLVNKWNVLFQKSTQWACFAIFSMFCDYRSQYWSYDHIVYIFFHLQNIPQLLLGTDFLFDV